MNDEIYSLIKKSYQTEDFKNLKRLSQQVQNLLFDIYRNDLANFFCDKIFSRKVDNPTELTDFDILGKTTTSKVADQLIEGIKHSTPQTLNLKEHCMNMAKIYWKNLVRKSNEGDPESFNLLFAPCRLKLQGYFRGRLGISPASKSDRPDEFVNSAYINATQRKADNPYILEQGHSFYQYFHFISEAQYLTKRPVLFAIKQNGTEIPIRKSNKKESVVSTLLKDNESQKDQLARIIKPQNACPEDDLIAIQAIRRKLEEEKRLLSIKLTTLTLCSYCAKPHQFFAFGFNKWLQNMPAQIVKEHSFKLFENLYQEFMESTEKKIMENPFIIKGKSLPMRIDPRKSLEPFRERLECETEELYKTHENELLIQHHYRTRVTKLSFNIFYEKDPSHSPPPPWDKWPKTLKRKYQQKISDWADKARKSAMNGLSLRETES